MRRCTAEANGALQHCDIRTAASPPPSPRGAPSYIKAPKSNVLIKAPPLEARWACLGKPGGERMTESNTCSEVMIPMFVLVSKWSENRFKLKTVLQNKTAGVWGCVWGCW